MQRDRRIGCPDKERSLHAKDLGARLGPVIAFALAGHDACLVASERMHERRLGARSAGSKGGKGKPGRGEPTGLEGRGCADCASNRSGLVFV